MVIIRTMYQKISDFNAFRAEVKKQLALLGWRYEDLSEYVGYSPHYIAMFMCGRCGSRRMARKIARTLGIPIEEYHL